MGGRQARHLPLPMVLLALLVLTIAWSKVIVGDGQVAQATSSSRGVVLERQVDDDTSDGYGEALAGSPGLVWADRSLVLDGRDYVNHDPDLDEDVESPVLRDALGDFDHGVILSLLANGEAGTPVEGDVVMEDRLGASMEVKGQPELLVAGHRYLLHPAASTDGVHRTFGIVVGEGDPRPEGLDRLSLTVTCDDEVTTLRLTVPRDLLPLTDGQDGTTPLRLAYVVGPEEGVVSEGIDERGRVARDGSVALREGSSAAELTLGVAADPDEPACVTFTPTGRNPHYRNGAVVPLYRGGIPGSVAEGAHVVHETVIGSRGDLEGDRTSTLLWVETATSRDASDEVLRASMAELEALGLGDDVVLIDGATCQVVAEPGDGCAVALSATCWRPGFLMGQGIRVVSRDGGEALELTLPNDGSLVIDGSLDPVTVSVPLTVFSSTEDDCTVSLTPVPDNPEADPVVARRIPMEAKGTTDLLESLGFTAPGTYRYVVREEIDAEVAATEAHDGSVHGIRVVVREKGEGVEAHLEAEVSLTRDGEAEESLRLEPKATSGALVPLEGVIRSEEGSPLPANLTIEALSEGAPMPGRSQVGCEADGTFRFGLVEITSPGRHSYRVIQTPTADAGVRWATEPVEVVIEAEMVDGALVARRSPATVSLANSIAATSLSLSGTQWCGGDPTTSTIDVLPGDVVSYGFDLAAGDTASARDVTVELAVPSSLEVVPGSISAGGAQEAGWVRWTIPAVDAAAHSSVSLSLRIPDDAPEGQVSVSASATLANGVEDAGSVSSEPLGLRVMSPTTTVRGSELVMECGQAIGDGTFSRETLRAQSGETVEYRVRLTNLTDHPIEGLDLTATVNGASAQGRDQGPTASEGDGLLWQGERLEAHESREYRLAAQLPEDEGETVSMSAHAAWDGIGVREEVRTEPLRAMVLAATAEPTQTDALCLIQQAQAGEDYGLEVLEVLPGSRISYLVTLQGGEKGIDDARVTIEMIEGLTLVEGSASSDVTLGEDGILWEAGTVAPEGTRTLSFEAEVPTSPGELTITCAGEGEGVTLEGNSLTVIVTPEAAVPEVIEDMDSPEAATLTERLRERFPALGDETSPAPYILASIASLLTMGVALTIRRCRES